MLWAACCLGFFGFMRAGEFTEQSPQQNSEPMLSASDISNDRREKSCVLIVHLKRSKTDPFGVGAYLHLGHADDDILCSVSAVLAYMAVRPPGPDPLFHFHDGSPLSRARQVQHVRQALSQAGLNTV